MSYRPPALRQQDNNPPAFSSSSNETSGNSSNNSYKSRPVGQRNDYGSRNGSRDNRYKNPYGGYNNGSYGYDKRDNAPPSFTHPPIEPIFNVWKASERVLSLNDKQVSEIRQRLNVVVAIEKGSEKAITPIESFKEMNLHEDIYKDIVDHKYENPTPIQSQGIPIALSGRDILGCAETGSGKTASFSIPMIQHCLNQPPLRLGDGPMALVLAPTRELAQQIEKEVKAFSQTCCRKGIEAFNSHSSCRRVRAAVVVGGNSIQDQKQILHGGVEIVVATPGRFKDLLEQRVTNLHRVSYIVLDEADRMLDMGFEQDIKLVMSSLPEKHQSLLFSATMPKEIEELARTYLSSPVTVKIGTVSTPTANVTQHLEHAEESMKIELLVTLLGEEVERDKKGLAPMPLTIVFVERKSRCDEVADALRKEGISACALHGDLKQNEREAALRDFSKGEVKVLVATDVASRGLDIKGIGHVVNMDLPKQFENYVHRIGRTGRAGTKGRSTSFWNEGDSFIVSQIKQALSEVEKGNTFAFATGKEARKEERQLSKEFKSQMNLGSQSSLNVGSRVVKVEDKYSFMLSSSATTAKSNAADAAWDD
mmetsp:Transcript_10664/g.19475  ORF Transcript_10664/g.19475 Transcript_10664/m.19475 type:complete len:593 (-) Transcript_10664:729-2507(-)|eukprot:CAMPEP_0175047990 /NCGR_PEP_ID=MMETSP0052_2-20121109/5918_1 /TAXON_ID=51329 ORGANISM="Polytomella parva, Strain SAG 63-3" /NCGR_SAMPLE_ID=MMETSP0052_2 /ASSEMBLY_ACC=CAM_ASM_000194 /LENGTH=592 /DNA_ID=CAMNT_0016311959 /DNA_START=26 /DNA_END=1804 /DNA_ORIENTATION=+